MNNVKKSIGWADFTINPIKGLCPVGCPSCYALRMYKRFHWDPEIRYEPQDMLDCATIRKPSKIFVGSTMELFGTWVKDEWREQIFEYCRRMSMHTFLFLTKKPENLAKWSPFPPNCWVGVSATNYTMNIQALLRLGQIQARIKFVSYEPLQAQLMILPEDFKVGGISWVIIGQQTPVKDSTSPRIEWIREIVEGADKAGIPVFLKDNLLPVFVTPKQYNFVYDAFPWAIDREAYNERCENRLRQEFPRGTG